MNANENGSGNGSCANASTGKGSVKGAGPEPPCILAVLLPAPSLRRRIQATDVLPSCPTDRLQQAPRPKAVRLDANGVIPTRKTLLPVTIETETGNASGNTRWKENVSANERCDGELHSDLAPLPTYHPLSMVVLRAAMSATQSAVHPLGCPVNPLAALVSSILQPCHPDGVQHLVDQVPWVDGAVSRVQMCPLLLCVRRRPPDMHPTWDITTTPGLAPFLQVTVACSLLRAVHPNVCVPLPRMARTMGPYPSVN